MLTAKKIVELRHRLQETEAELNTILADYFSEVQYITPQGPTAGVYNLIQIQNLLVNQLAEEERKVRGGK